MSAMSDYAELKVLDHLLGTTTFTRPSAVYLGLFTSDPTDAGSGTEVSGTGYARQSVAFDAAASGETANTSKITFPTVGSGGWGTITHWGLFDALTSGNLLVLGAWDASKAYDEDDVFEVPAGDLDITAA